MCRCIGFFNISRQEKDIIVGMSAQNVRFAN